MSTSHVLDTPLLTSTGMEQRDWSGNTLSLLTSPPTCIPHYPVVDKSMYDSLVYSASAWSEEISLVDPSLQHAMNMVLLCLVGITLSLTYRTDTTFHVVIMLPLPLHLSSPLPPTTHLHTFPLPSYPPPVSPSLTYSQG